MFKEKDGKYTEGRLKVSPIFPSKACTSTHDSLLFAAPVEESKQRGNHAFVWIYKQCLSVSTELILCTVSFGSWGYQATTEMVNACNFFWPDWTFAPPHSVWAQRDQLSGMEWSVGVVGCCYSARARLNLPKKKKKKESNSKKVFHSKKPVDQTTCAHFNNV